MASARNLLVLLLALLAASNAAVLRSSSQKAALFLQQSPEQQALSTSSVVEADLQREDQSLQLGGQQGNDYLSIQNEDGDEVLITVPEFALLYYMGMP